MKGGFMTKRQVDRLIIGLAALVILGIILLMMQGCVGTVLPPPGSSTVQQLPLERLTPKQQLTIGWQTYNKLWEDYVRLKALPNPSQAEIKVMTTEYALINKAYPVLIKATEAFEANQPLATAVLDVIRELTLSVRF